MTPSLPESNDSGSRRAVSLPRRLYQDALRADLPEFIALALIYQAGAGDLASLPLARTLAVGIVNPALHGRASALEGPRA